MNEQNTNDYTGKADVNQPQENQTQNQPNKPETRPEQNPEKNDPTGPERQDPGQNDPTREDPNWNEPIGGQGGGFKENDDEDFAEQNDNQQVDEGDDS